MTNDTLAKLAADNVPERIYLVLGEDIAPDDDPRADFNDLGDVTWCADKQFNHDIEYVRADVAALTAQALPAAEPVRHSGADETPPVFGRRWKLAVDGFGLQRDDMDGNYVHIDDALSVLHQAAQQAAQVPATHFTGAFAGVAGRKLAELQSAGYQVNGYSLMHTATRARGFIDAGGFVGWWSNRDHEQAAQATAMPEDQIEAMAHRMCWQYRHSTDPAHSSTYKFNRNTLIDFARKLELGWPASLATAALQQSIATMGSAAQHLEGLPKMHQGKLLAHDLRRAASCCETAIAALPQPQPQSAQAKGDA